MLPMMALVEGIWEIQVTPFSSSPGWKRVNSVGRQDLGQREGQPGWRPGLDSVAWGGGLKSQEVFQAGSWTWNRSSVIRSSRCLTGQLLGRWSLTRSKGRHDPHGDLEEFEDNGGRLGLGQFGMHQEFGS